jgi:ATP-binding cassette subfamily B protein
MGERFALSFLCFINTLMLDFAVLKVYNLMKKGWCIMEEKRKYKSSHLIKRFLPYYKPYWATLVLDLICASLTTVCEIILPLIMREITNAGINDLATLTIRYVLRVGLLYFALRIIDSAAYYYMAYTGHVMGTKIETDMRRDAYSHLQNLSDSYFNNTKVGQIMGRITNDLFDVTEFAHHCPEEFLIAGVKGIVSFIILLSINIPLTIIIFLIIPIMFFVCKNLNTKMRSTFRQQRQLIGELNARIEDSLLGQKVVKAFANEDVEREKFEKDNFN